jgi:Bacterial Ig domain
MNQFDLEEAVANSSGTSRGSLEAGAPDSRASEAISAGSPARLMAGWGPAGGSESAFAMSAGAYSAAAPSFTPERARRRSLVERPLLPAWAFVGLGAVCVVAMVWVGMAGAPNCHVQPMPLALGTESSASITIPANTPCTVTVAAGGTSIEEIAIDVMPRHGTATLRGRTGVTYRPAPRFTGDDSFAFSIRGRAGSTTGRSLVQVRATVK